MKQSNRTLSVSFLALTLAISFALTACSSKKKVDDEATTPADNSGSSDKPPAIDSSAAMNFDAAGSDSGKIDGLRTVNFDYDKASLNGDSKKKIEGNVAWMKKNPKVNIQIEGHCDSRGTIEYNLALGERRAQSVKNYMAGLGISNSRISIISYGKEKPLTNGDSDSEQSKNRRANFLPLAQ